MKNLILLSVAACFGFTVLPMFADSFGSGTNQFAIVFVDVLNAGNGDDLGAGGGSHSSPYGGVAYNYRISKYEITQAAIDKATALGMSNVTAGAWSADKPAASLLWYEAAAFVNWLNTNEGYHEAYDLVYAGSWSMTLWPESERAGTGVDAGSNSYRHKDAFYFLPSEDEWYKAAYHKNDGVTSNYWDYPTGSNIEPDGLDFANDPDFEAVFRDGVGGYDPLGPYAVTNAGSIPSAYGTCGQGGNCWEWLESAYDGSNDNVEEEYLVVRGGGWSGYSQFLRSSYRDGFDVWTEDKFTGFRIASLPEPRPTVQISMESPNAVLLSWTPDLAGFILQESVSLSPLTWTNSPSGTNNPSMVVIGAESKLFRVAKP